MQVPVRVWYGTDGYRITEEPYETSSCTLTAVHTCTVRTAEPHASHELDHVTRGRSVCVFRKTGSGSARKALYLVLRHGITTQLCKAKPRNCCRFYLFRRRLTAG
eukprot:scaffold636366_cov18-Prasinocladus_malaysianus.AAC.1